LFAEKYADEIAALLTKYPDKQSAILPVMFLAQNEFGYMGKEAMTAVADALDLPLTHVLSIAGFYTCSTKSRWANMSWKFATTCPAPCAARMNLWKWPAGNWKSRWKAQPPTASSPSKPSCAWPPATKRPMLQVNLNYEENLDEEKFDQLIRRLREAS
jgi:hypothetical protein